MCIKSESSDACATRVDLTADNKEYCKTKKLVV